MARAGGRGAGPDAGRGTRAAVRFRRDARDDGRDLARARRVHGAAGRRRRLPRRRRPHRSSVPGADRRLIIRTFSRLLFAAYFLEAGFIITVAPWSVWWDRNHFADDRPALRVVIDSPYVRGAVSGVGVVTAVAGLVELGGVLASRPRRNPQP